jgi:hypothetical protein
MREIRSESVTIKSSAGYTPVEQMNSQAVPQSDFFALGLTFIKFVVFHQQNLLKPHSAKFPAIFPNL